MACFKRLTVVIGCYVVASALVSWSALRDMARYITTALRSVRVTRPLSWLGAILDISIVICLALVILFFTPALAYKIVKHWCEIELRPAG